MLRIKKIKSTYSSYLLRISIFAQTIRNNDDQKMIGVKKINKKALL